MPSKWSELSPGQIEDAFEAKAENDAGYAIAYALCRLSAAQSRTADALDRIGFNGDGVGPGTTEFIGMEMKRMAEAMQGIVVALQRDR